MSKKILGLDIGSNSIGWALLEMSEDSPGRLIDIGSRIFIKAVEDKTPTPKNVKRRDARLARRVIQRRARRKQRMLNYLVKLHLLPAELKDHSQPEIILNELGNPYQLRAKALDEKLTPHQVGRVLLHLVQRRGFLSNRKTLIGDMADDPDVIAALAELEGEDDASSERGAEETAFKKDITALRESINEKNCRTLGEYLAGLDPHNCKRNRSHNGGYIRTDRQMYREELDLIWECQSSYHEVLTADVREQIDQIIFFQRPLKLRSDRIGKCSLEPNRKRIKIAHPAYQRFRYLQDVNNLSYFDPYSEKHVLLNDDQRQKLIEHFESKPSITVPQLKKLLGIDRTVEVNLERGNKKLKGNITICGIKDALPEWDALSELKKNGIIEDLLTIKKKSVLKKRLIEHWQIETDRAIDMCFLEFEPDHGSLSLKAINNLLPHLEAGLLYSEARVAAGYGYEVTEIEVTEKLGQPPEIANPIVNKALHELRRLVNAIISEYGKIDVFRVEMARDLEMNTKRYKALLKQQRDNTSANDEAVEKYRDIAARTPELKLSTYPSRNDKIRYRLWKDQEERCVYSGKMIPLSALFTAEIDVDHIIPYSQSLDDSYMNKVLCYAAENRYKGQRTPKDAFGGNEEKWNQITQSIRRWEKKLSSKQDRFYRTEAEVLERDFIGSQLNDTRYISRVALEYLQQLGAEITTTKGVITAWLRHQWGLDDLIGNSVEKDRVDHRHHAIDAVVTACIDRGFYNNLVGAAKGHERSHPELRMRDLHVDPPWTSLRDNLKDKLENMIVSHAPQRKLAGALHEETGVGYIEGIGNVTRKTLASDFTQTDKIYDASVREAVTKHLAKYGGNAKEAFAEGVTVLHKDGKTPIKRVRIVQSKTTLDKLERTKLGIKNSSGEVFKWHAYGNIHHLAVLKHKETGKFSGRLVTVMEAAKRARGINIEPGGIYQLSEKEEFEFITAVHINDLVEINVKEVKGIYRVRKLGQLDSGGNPRLTLNYHSDAQSGMQEVSDSISNLMHKYAFRVLRINAIGKVIQ